MATLDLETVVDLLVEQFLKLKCEKLVDLELAILGYEEEHKD